MKTKFAVSSIFFLLFITACSATPTQPTATPVDVPAIQTAAVGTALANITETAAAFIPPTEEPTATITITPTLNLVDTLTPTITPTETACDDMIFVSDVTIPDKTEMSPGQEFVKTWKVKNIGSCEWKTNYILVFGYGDSMSGQNTAITVNIAPGAEGEVSVNLKAPTPLGTYTGNWRLQNNNGFNFGVPLIVVIVVR